MRAAPKHSRPARAARRTTRTKSRGRPPDSPDPEKTGRTRSTAGVELKIHSGFSPGVRRTRSRKGAGGGGSGRPLRGGAALARCAQRGRAGSSESQVKVDKAALCEPHQGKVKRKSSESQAKVSVRARIATGLSALRSLSFSLFPSMLCAASQRTMLSGQALKAGKARARPLRSSWSTSSAGPAAA